MLHVKVRPADYLGGGCEFRVLTALQEVLRLKRKHTVAGILQTPCNTSGDSEIVLEILGKYDTRTIRALQTKFKHVRGVVKSFVIPDNSRALWMLLRGPWRSAEAKLNKDLSKDGISITIYE